MASYHHSLRILLIAALASIFLTYIHLLSHIRQVFHPRPTPTPTPTPTIPFPTIPRFEMIPNARIITQTYTTTNQGHEVLLDVIIPPTLLDDVPSARARARAKENVPLVVAFHGGGLIRGCRREEYIFKPILDAITTQRYILISADYRLLYPSTGSSIQSDISSLFNYLTTPTFTSSLPIDISPDLHSIAVIGFSAGGYVARLAGIQEAMESQKENQRFKIKTCISYFGMGGDFLIDKWINGTTQSEKDRLEPLVEMVISSGNNKSLVEESDRPYTSTLEGYDTSERTKYIWDYWLATGTLIDILTSTNGKGSSLCILPYTQRLSSLSNSDSNVIPQLWLTKSPIAKFFPPTLLIHGTSDDAVPYEESLNTLNQLEKLGVEVELITVEGADHNLNKARVTKEAEAEGEEEAVEAEGTKEAHQKVVRWLIKAMG